MPNTTEKVAQDMANNFSEEVSKLSSMNLDTMADKFIEWATVSGVKLLIGLIIISIGLKLIKKIIKHFIIILEKRDVDVTLRRFLQSLISGGLKGILFIFILGYWGFDLAGMAAIFASAGVAIGLALQGSLSNFAGGFIILLLRPFKVGDYIEAGIYGGTVEQIGLFYTQLVTIDNKLILIPNGTLSNGSLINYSAKSERRVDLTFSVGYENDLSHVKNVLTNIINRHGLIIKEPVPFIGVSAHGPSSVDFVVRVWCKSEDYWAIHFDLLEQVKLKFDEEKITIPYPQMDLHLKKSDLKLE
ncbi:mechanosensitive ion channel family protein [Romboutsia lituseburensis]|uniref:Small conductance mechanosensitive channel n=1 Tax=Romboutsia lituseburensis DSM 797 TaxID=1121325 RepID=A0A1G9L2Q9_9FIRM|nr:mechanosensitive ion channel domain-containing protein [Romboutsia lituseburensis]CEH35118.1 Small-conductance mechanosensitive channel [Romboutsia lituseburensis]SDL55987.1 small conductance mechanosensitive channel [Romboutsia lituseburensis DSM 797]